MPEESEKSTPSSDPKTVFVVSPIGSPGSVSAVNASLVLEYIIRQALQGPEWKVVRADEEKDPGSITHMVIKRIVDSDLIVADLTDHNPNVFYELAVAHGYKKPVVTIMTDGQKPPFDIIDMRTVFYDLANPASVHTAKVRLQESARAALDNPNPTNPLVAYDMFSTASNQSDASPSDKLEFAMAQILARLAQIESRMEGENWNSATAFAPAVSTYVRHASARLDAELAGERTRVSHSYVTRRAELTRQLSDLTSRIESLENSGQLMEPERDELDKLLATRERLVRTARGFDVDVD